MSYQLVAILLKRLWYLDEWMVAQKVVLWSAADGGLRNEGKGREFLQRSWNWISLHATTALQYILFLFSFPALFYTPSQSRSVSLLVCVSSLLSFSHAVPFLTTNLQTCVNLAMLLSTFPFLIVKYLFLIIFPLYLCLWNFSLFLVPFLCRKCSAYLLCDMSFHFSYIL